MHLLLIIIITSILSYTLGNMNSEIERINSIQKYWKADRNVIAAEGIEYAKILAGARISTTPILPVKNISEVIGNFILPNSFDARKRWHKCKTISTIENQGKCGSCWAISSTTCMADRLCISGIGNHITISAQNLISCCPNCGSKCPKGGGNVAKSWKYFEKVGIVTGGNYHSHEGCQPYQIGTKQASYFNNKISVCNRCTNTYYKIPYSEDKHFGTCKSYSVSSNVKAIQYEIFTGGPVVALFYLYHDFLYYKSGVYVRTSRKRVGAHAVRVLGWGTENGIDYWLAANSWSKHWGINGTFKIRRGKNECKFESFVTAGEVLR